MPAASFAASASGHHTTPIKLSFSTGDKLGPHEILSLVGKGGMGTERFTREARTIAEAGLARNSSLHPDGKRIAALMPVSASGDAKDATHVTILFNFFDELKGHFAAPK